MLYRALLILFLVVISGCSSVTPTEIVSLDGHGGQYRDAVDRFENEIKSYEAWDHYEPSGWFGSLTKVGMIYLCNAYFGIRNYSEAAACLEYWHPKVIPFVLEEQGQEGRAWVDANYHKLMAHITVEVGDFKKAFHHYQLSRKFNNQISGDACVTVLGISEQARLDAVGGIAAIAIGRRDQAIQIEQGIACIKHKGPELEINRDRKVKNASRAKIHLALNNYAQALDIMSAYSSDTKSIIARTVMGIYTLGLTELPGNSGFKDMTNPFSFDEQFMLGSIALGLKNYEQAESIYLNLLYESEDSETLSKQVINRPGAHYRLLHGLAQAAKHRGKTEKAISYYLESISIIELQRASINTEASRIGFFGSKDVIYQELIELLIEQGQIEQAFIYAEKGKSRALVDLLASKKDFKPTVKKAIDSDLYHDLGSLDKKLLTADYTTNPDQRSVDRGLLRIKTDQLYQSAPELASLVSVTPLDLKEIQSLLSSNETLIEYYQTHKNLYAFVISRKSLDVVSLDNSNLESDVTSFRQALSNTKSDDYINASRALYKRLFLPLEPQIHTREIIFVPTGALYYLPFNTLYSDNEFIVDHYQISYLPSASVLTYLNKRIQSEKPLLVLGNPDVGETSFDLPGAEREAKKISHAEAGTELLLRSEATESYVKKHAQQYRKLHFASHGVFNAEAPLDSGLMLSPDHTDDGFLSVKELYQLELNADLVTLSACDTALGTVSNGDDVVGFTRGFLFAGTNNIVSSLWKVDDDATSTLMQRFYDHLNQKMSKKQALQQAQLALKKEKPHPYYWGAFQLTGH